MSASADLPADEGAYAVPDEDQTSRLRRRAKVIRQIEDARTFRDQIAPRRARMARLRRSMLRF